MIKYLNFNIQIYINKFVMTTGCDTRYGSMFRYCTIQTNYILYPLAYIIAYCILCYLLYFRSDVFSGHIYTTFSDVYLSSIKRKPKNLKCYSEQLFYFDKRNKQGKATIQYPNSACRYIPWKME